MKGKPGILAILCSLSLAFGLALSGCGGGGGGGGGGSTPSAADGTGDTNPGGVTDPGGTTNPGGGATPGNPYAGTAAISGKVVLSQLGGTDQQALGRVAERSAGRVLAAAAAEAVVKLYVIGPDGSLQDTGLQGTLTPGQAEGEFLYQFPGVADGVNYVVRYLRKVSDTQVLELKASAFVPADATSVTGVEVSPRATVVVKALVDAVMSATRGTGITDAVVNRIIEAVKAAVVALVDAGVIEIPSMIAEADASDWNALQNRSPSEIGNENLDAVAGVLLSDDSVDRELGVIATETRAGQFDLASVDTDAEKRALIGRVFKELLDGDDGVPDFMIRFFGDVYVAGTQKTVGQMMEAIAAGLEWRIPSPPTISKSEAISAFKEELKGIYALLALKASGAALTDEQKRHLGEVPPIIFGLFPFSERTQWESLAQDTALNVPRAIAFTIYAIDVFLKERFEQAASTYEASQSDSGVVQTRREEPFEFNPLRPGSIMQLLGFFEVASQYSGLEVFDLWLHPGRTWISDASGQGGTEVDSLNAGACIGDVARMIAESQNPQAPAGSGLTQATVTLTYPTAAGPKQIALLPELNGPYGGPKMDTCFRLDPWMEATQGNPPTNGQPVQLNPARIVSDFISGTYKVTVTNAGQTVSRDYVKKVITGMTKVAPTLLSPMGMPQWPGNNASQAEMQKFNDAMSAYWDSQHNFAANVDTNGDGQNDAAKITVTWKAPQLTLPEGVKMGYSLDVGKGGCDNAGSCSWEQIFSTWERDKMLFTTAYTLPVNLPLQSAGDLKSYNLNVGVIFLDAESGQQLGQGGNAHAEFRVAEPLDLTRTFTINGIGLDGYKVALVRERFNPDLLTNQWESVVAREANVIAGSYSLRPTLGDFLDASMKGWNFNLIMYKDQDALGLQWEPRVWAQEGMWINTWGGQLKIGRNTCADPNVNCRPQETVVIGGETVTGPSFTSDPFNGGFPPPPNGGNPPPPSGGTIPPVGDADGDLIGDSLESNPDLQAQFSMDPNNASLPGRQIFDATRLAGTWTAGPDPFLGATATVVFSTATTPWSYTMEASIGGVRLMSDSGTWNVPDPAAAGPRDAIVLHSASTALPPEEQTKFLPVAFLDAGYTKVVVNLNELYTKAP